MTSLPAESLTKSENLMDLDNFDQANLNVIKEKSQENIEHHKILQDSSTPPINPLEYYEYGHFSTGLRTNRKKRDVPDNKINFLEENVKISKDSSSGSSAEYEYNSESENDLSQNIPDEDYRHFQKENSFEKSNYIIPKNEQDISLNPMQISNSDEQFSKNYFPNSKNDPQKRYRRSLMDLMNKELFRSVNLKWRDKNELVFKKQMLKQLMTFQKEVYDQVREGWDGEVAGSNKTRWSVAGLLVRLNSPNSLPDIH